MTTRRSWNPLSRGPHGSSLTVERVILIVLATGTLLSPETRTREAALVTPRQEKVQELHHTWRLVDGHSWQIVAPPNDSPPPADPVDPSGPPGACQGDMIEIAGRMKVERAGFESIEDLQNTTCTSWIQREFPERCARFDEQKWKGISANLPTIALHFCIDRYEYPDVKGQYPVIMTSWREAGATCAVRGKRLCTENEWTFACEGEDAMPYPIGYERDANACVIDRNWIQYHDVALSNRSSDAAMRELDALWQGTASGESPHCRSPFGVEDMTGNVDEWTVSTRREGLPSIFKGGYWGPVRGRCRASTRVHDPDFAFYQQGFRCCSAPSPAATPTAGPPPGETQPPTTGTPAASPPPEGPPEPGQDMLQPP